MADDSPTPQKGADEGAPLGSGPGFGAMPKLDQKVELDLDDAPFLMAEPEPTAQEATPEAGEDATGDAAPPPSTPLYKKPLVLAGLGGAIVALLGVALFMFLSKPTPPPSPPPPPAPMADLPPPRTSIQAQPVQEGGQQRFLMNMTPFVILLESKAGPRMLTFKFSVYADDLAAQYAMQQNELRLRNLIYDFLRVRTTEELTASSSVTTLKESLRETIAAALPDTKVGEVFIEQIQLQ